MISPSVFRRLAPLIGACSVALAAPVSRQEAATTIEAAVVSFEQDGKQVELLVDGGKVRAKVDGSVLSADQIRFDLNGWCVIQAAGKLVASVRPCVDPTAFAAKPSTTMGIGVQVTEVDGALAAQLGFEPHAALVVLGVDEGKPAAQAGLQPYDVITEIAGERPATQQRLQQSLASIEPGSTVRLGLLRKGTPLEVTLTPRPIELKRMHAMPMIDSKLVDDRGEISGIVLDASGNPIQNAVVSGSLESEGRLELRLVPMLRQGVYSLSLEESEPKTASDASKASDSEDIQSQLSAIREQLDRIESRLGK